MSDYRISVIIPVLNGESTLKKCLEAIFVQSLQPHEIIVIDNNSTDGTKSIITDLQGSHANLKYVFEKKRSRGAARHAGVDAVTGDITVMTDVDCIVPVNWIEMLIQPITDGNEVAVVGYQSDPINNFWTHNIQKLDEYCFFMNVYDQNYIHFIDTKNFAIKSQLLKTLQFDRDFGAQEDLDLTLRLHGYGKIFFAPFVIVQHFHADSLRTVTKMAFRRGYWMTFIENKRQKLNSPFNAPRRRLPLKVFIRNLGFVRPKGPGLRLTEKLFIWYFNLIWDSALLYGYFKNTK